MKTLVAVIAYNEEKSLGGVLRDLEAQNCGFDVVVIDNGSTDNTASVAREHGVPVVAHCINTGGSMGTVTSYFKYAYEHGYECLCQFDGDGQHIAEELPHVIEPVERGEADYVIGSRFLAGEGFQSTAVRRLGIRIFSLVDSILLRQRVLDVTSGFRAYSRRVIELFGRTYRLELHDTNQLLLISRFHGARVMEVPVRMRERRHGESEYDWLNALVYPMVGVMSILGVWLQRSHIERDGEN
jgi:glycosyltransferase involved in cell wall biosynthesis